MSHGGQSSTTVGLPQNSTAPGMGSLGIGGGIYGNPYQVMGLSQPSGLTLQGQQNQPEDYAPNMDSLRQAAAAFQPFSQMLPRSGGPSAFRAAHEAYLAQQGPQLLPSQMVPRSGGPSAFAAAHQAYLSQQGQRGDMFNQPRGMQAGLGSLVPGNYASQR